MLGDAVILSVIVILALAGNRGNCVPVFSMPETT